MKPELETDGNNSETVSERSRDKVCRWVENLSKDFDASTSKPELGNDNLEIDSEYSRYNKYYKVEYEALLDSCFRFQKWLSIETAVEYRVWKVEDLPPSWVEIISWIQSGSPT